MNDATLSENSNKPNYITYQRAYFQLKISHYLPSASNMLFMVLLYEANELGFPSRFSLPNSTLAKEANTKVHNLYRDRQKLLEFRLLKDDDNSWLIKYEQGFYPESGEYIINYELLSQNFIDANDDDKFSMIHQCIIKGTTPQNKSINYKDYLLSNDWQIVRRIALAHFGNKCQLCGSTQNLNVHHKNYDNIGNETLDDLTLLCKSCHEKFHT